MLQFYRNKIFGWKVSLETLKDLMDQLIIILVDGNLEKCNNGSVYVKVTNLLCVKVIEKCDHTKIIWYNWEKNYLACYCN